MATTRYAPGSARGRPESGTAFWLVLDGHGLAPPLTVPTRAGGADEQALAVFSDEAGALAFCGSRDGGGLLLREASAKEIVSLLYGRWSPARLVALDPVPGSRGLTGLATLGRDRFARGFLRRTPWRSPRRGRGRPRA